MAKRSSKRAPVRNIFLIETNSPAVVGASATMASSVPVSGSIPMCAPQADTPPARRKRTAAGGRPRNDRLNKIVLANPEAPAKDIIKAFKSAYGRLISDGKAKVPTDEAIRQAKSRLRKAGELD